MAPMGQYSAVDGLVSDWHLVHYGSRATGGVGLIITEMTAISETGRITEGCAGIYNAEQVNQWKKLPISSITIRKQNRNSIRTFRKKRCY